MTTIPKEKGRVPEKHAPPLVGSRNLPDEFDGDLQLTRVADT